MDTKQKRFSVTVPGDYIYLKTWGKLDMDDLEEPADTAIKLGKENKIDRLLDDIREIDTTNVSIPIQTKAVGIIWKLRAFKKVAVVYKNQEIGRLFFASLEALHLSSKFRGFDDETQAIAWLHEG